MTTVDAPSRATALQSRERVWGRLGASRRPRIARLAVAGSGTSLSQEEVLARLRLRGDEFAEGIFERCGVHRRELDFLGDAPGQTLQSRSARVEEALFERAVQATDQLQIEPRTIGTVISSTLYSLACPTLAHRLVEHYGLDPSADKYHLTGVGCASAVPLMRLGAQSLRQHPRKRVLVVAAESMSSILMPAGEHDPRAKTVGSAIFGDGCAAALLSDDVLDGGPAIRASQTHQLRGTLGAVRLQVEPQDSYLQLARELPDLAGAGLGGLVRDFLQRRHLDRGGVQHWIVHPGGRRIIEAVQAALALSDEDVQESWRALAHHGNVGTPSIFYVLGEVIRRREPGPGERGLLVTIGPGVTVGLMLLEW